MNTTVSLWRPLMNPLPRIVSVSPIFNFIGEIDLTTGAVDLLAFFATAGIAAASRSAGMARRARRVRARLIEHGIGASRPHLERGLDV
jgi:hypothetical protein